MNGQQALDILRAASDVASMDMNSHASIRASELDNLIAAIANDLADREEQVYEYERDKLGVTVTTDGDRRHVEIRLEGVPYVRGWLEHPLKDVVIER